MHVQRISSIVDDEFAIPLNQLEEEGIKAPQEGRIIETGKERNIGIEESSSERKQQAVDQPCDIEWTRL